MNQSSVKVVQCRPTMILWCVQNESIESNRVKSNEIKASQGIHKRYEIQHSTFHILHVYSLPCLDFHFIRLTVSFIRLFVSYKTKYLKRAFRSVFIANFLLSVLLHTIPNRSTRGGYLKPSILFWICQGLEESFDGKEFICDFVMIVISLFQNSLIRRLVAGEFLTLCNQPGTRTSRFDVCWSHNVYYSMAMAIQPIK